MYCGCFLNVVYDTQLSAEFSPGNLSERVIPFLYREKYVPFWFQTFRFVHLEVETKDEPMTLHFDTVILLKISK